VTPIPGTTRDTIEETLDIGGVPVQAVDTAGLRDTLDPVESIGVERALTSIRSADIRLLVLDQSEPLSEEDWKAFEATYGEATLIVLNKSDLPSAWSCNTRDDRLIVDGKVIALASWPAPPETVEAAAALDEGIDRVEQAILRTVFGGRIVPADSLAGGGMRQSIALEHAAASLRHASATVQSGEPIDLVSVDLHGALQSLGEITGQTAPEDLLHEIFGRFCIGK
jgi:tRNA modification GTPase